MPGQNILDISMNTPINNHLPDANFAVHRYGRSGLEIKIRHEVEADHLAVELLTRETFWNLYRPGCDEHYTAHIIRRHQDALPELTFVAEVNGEIVGSIIYTRSWVINDRGERFETATFGPLSVNPGLQRQGIGTALIEYSRLAAAERGYPAIVILGDPHNYVKHGFKTGKDVSLSTLDGKYPLGLLALELRRGFFASSPQWQFQTSDVYQFDAALVERFDARFPPKEKMHHYSQDLFSILMRAVVE
jgi:putative acetyltransferase